MVLSASQSKRVRGVCGAVAIAALLVCTAPVARAESFPFPPTDFTILTPDFKTELGHIRCTLEADYRGCGASWGEPLQRRPVGHRVDRFEVTESSGPPQLVEFRHSFFAAGGTPTLNGYANIRSGLATCTAYIHGSKKTLAERLTFPNDTYAGAGVLVPIQLHLRSSVSGPLKLHAFNCAPMPRVIAINVAIAPRPQALQYPGNLVEVVVKPDFGSWNIPMRALLPKLEAWFAPDDQFRFVGGELVRFYKGPKVLMVKSAGHQAAAENASAPSEQFVEKS